ncbi:T9SS type A sorting domain-containing protein, partial [Flavobacterium selenitireducens]|uniref:T9SS type A sorting domain-containing protein n=1 Tax=Flavobacterium selenitireducens TaxID=2722704 RepID=UPI00168A4065
DNVIFYQDLDGDGFGSDVQAGCGVSNNDDCDDNQILYADNDGDGFGNSATQSACGVANNLDCNDNVIFYEDLDGDGFGSDVQAGCGVSNSDDCDDNDSLTTTGDTFYADADGDGFGNPIVSVTACSQPVGYVSNNTDCDDNNASIYRTGTFYVDNDGDGYNNGATQSVCYGETVPEGFVQADNGLDCNDANASVYRTAQFYVDFDGDGYNNGTQETICYGASIPFGYTNVDNGLDCDDTSDSVNPAQEEILGNGIDDNCNGVTDEGGPQVFSQVLPSQCGTTMASISTLIGAVSKARATSYRFRITNLTNNNVQTIVKTAPHFQLTGLASYDYATTYAIEVEVQIDGIWVGSFGPVCNVSTPAILDEGGSASVTPSQCGGTLPSLSSLIATTSIPGVKGYRFKITNTLTNEVQSIDRTQHWFSLTQLASFNYGTTYVVEVAVRTNGDFTGFGAPCLVSTPDIPTLVNCDYIAPSATSPIATVSLNRVTTYRFEVTNLSDFSTQVVSRTLHFFSFSYVPDYIPGGQYAVRVSLMTSGSWSPYGEACLVTAPGAARSSVKSDDTSADLAFRAVVYPNPYSESFALDMDVVGDENVKVKVYDMIGKLIDEREFGQDQIEMQQFGERYPSGVYNVIVTQGANIKTLRVVKR